MNSPTAMPIAGEQSLVSPPVSLIVVTYGSQHLVGNLLKSLKEHPDGRIIREVVVVDNGYPEMGDCRMYLTAAEYPFAVQFLQHYGRSYSGSVNLGAASCGGPVLVLSDNDVEWLPGFSIGPAVDEILRHPEVGVAGPQLVFPGGRWQRSAGPFPSVREALGSMMLLGVLENRMASARHARGLHGPVRDVDYVDGACMAVSRKCFDQLRGFDPDCDFYAVDTDFSWRAKLAGWRRVIVPAAQVMHIRGASSSGLARKTYAKRLFGAKKWFVQRMEGKGHAAWYDVLQRAAAVEYAVLYSILAAIWRTPTTRRRALSARAVAEAAVEGDRGERDGNSSNGNPGGTTNHSSDGVIVGSALPAPMPASPGAAPSD